MKANLLKNLKRVKVKGYVKKLYPGYNKQMHFKGMRADKVKFDLSVTIPAEAVSHLKRHKGKYIPTAHIGGSAIAGYIGSRAGSRKRQRR